MIDRQTLTDVGAFIEERFGLHFPEQRWEDLERALAAASLAWRGPPPAPGCCWRPPPQLNRLARHLTVGETYFWREPASFEQLEQVVLPDLVRERPARLWSAGCCSGGRGRSIAAARCPRSGDGIRLSEYRKRSAASRAAEGCRHH